MPYNAHQSCSYYIMTMIHILNYRPNNSCTPIAYIRNFSKYNFTAIVNFLVASNFDYMKIFSIKVTTEYMGIFEIYL